VSEAAGLVRHAVVLVAVIDVSQLPASLHGGSADDGAESHGERDDDHGEWFDHLGGLRTCVWCELGVLLLDRGKAWAGVGWELTSGWLDREGVGAGPYVY